MSVVVFLEHKRQIDNKYLFINHPRYQKINPLKKASDVRYIFLSRKSAGRQDGGFVSDGE
jgi:hypothetical protein